ncbi:hypothetical protein BC830DRAFT_1089617 [Chytriomyces sp. MP71]|nr:hypothetical protein BC830DRAFT_1089617 [Chytriomyces sp. MP71]
MMRRPATPPAIPATRGIEMVLLLSEPEADCWEDVGEDAKDAEEIVTALTMAEMVVVVDEAAAAVVALAVAVAPVNPATVAQQASVGTVAQCTSASATVRNPQLASFGAWAAAHPASSFICASAIVNVLSYASRASLLPPFGQNVALPRTASSEATNAAIVVAQTGIGAGFGLQLDPPPGPNWFPSATSPAHSAV